MRVVWLRAAALSVVFASLSAAQRPAPDVIAIGDIHGADQEFSALLREVGLADARDAWRGGGTVLVQTGDFLDRGAHVRSVMDRLMRLEREAAAAGGRVVVLLGNHETMNLMHDLRDVSPAAYEAFRHERSEARLADAYAEYVEYVERRAKAWVPAPPAVAKEAWREGHPAGLLEYLEAFGPKGTYGRWLRSKDIVAPVDGTLFLHGGLSPDRGGSLDEINRRARDELARFDRYVEHLVERDVILPFFTFPEIMSAASRELDAWIVRLWPGPLPPDAPPLALAPDDRRHLEILSDLMTIGGWSIIDPDGPLWFRGYAVWPEDEPTSARLGALLGRHGVRRVVVGHTIPATHRITERFGGRVLLIDTGMLSTHYPGGRASALQIAGDRLMPLYLERDAPGSPLAR